MPIKGNGGKAAMADNIVKIEIDPYRQVKVNKIGISREELEKFADVVARAYKTDKPAKEDLQFIRKTLSNNPMLSKAVFGLVESVQDLIIKNMTGMKPAEIALEEYTLRVRDQMGYNDAPIMEQLLIENIITCWLRVNWIESQLSMFMGRQMRFAELEFWERRLSMAQRRYLAACESLAKIRKMKVPALQLNIGEKQINVAGDLVSTPRNG
jgi:hypothetical protein